MATTLTISAINPHRENAHIAHWTLGDADTGTSVEMPGSNIRSVQIAGTFGSATIVLEGSNDGTNYVTLDDNEGTAISKTAAFFGGVRDICRYIRAKSSGGTGTAVTVDLLLVRRGN